MDTKTAAKGLYLAIIYTYLQPLLVASTGQMTFFPAETRSAVHFYENSVGVVGEQHIYIYILSFLVFAKLCRFQPAAIVQYSL